MDNIRAVAVGACGSMARSIGRDVVYERTRSIHTPHTHINTPLIKNVSHYERLRRPGRPGALVAAIFIAHVHCTHTNRVVEHEATESVRHRRRCRRRRPRPRANVRDVLVR